MRDGSACRSLLRVDICGGGPEVSTSVCCSDLAAGGLLITFFDTALLVTCFVDGASWAPLFGCPWVGAVAVPVVVFVEVTAAAGAKEVLYLRMNG